MSDNEMDEITAEPGGSIFVTGCLVMQTPNAAPGEAEKIVRFIDQETGVMTPSPLLKVDGSDDHVHFASLLALTDGLPDDPIIERFAELASDAFDRATQKANGIGIPFRCCAFRTIAIPRVQTPESLFEYDDMFPQPGESPS